MLFVEMARTIFGRGNNLDNTEVSQAILRPPLSDLLTPTENRRSHLV